MASAIAGQDGILQRKVCIILFLAIYFSSGSADFSAGVAPVEVSSVDDSTCASSCALVGFLLC